MIDFDKIENGLDIFDLKRGFTLRLIRQVFRCEQLQEIKSITDGLSIIDDDGNTLDFVCELLDGDVFVKDTSIGRVFKYNNRSQQFDLFRV